MRLKTVIAAVCGACLACSLAAAPLASAEEAAAPGGSAPVVGEPGEVEPTPPAAESFKGAEFVVGGYTYKVTKISSAAIEKDSCEAALLKFEGSGTAAKVPATVSFTAGGFGSVALKVTAIGKDAFNNTKGHKIKSAVIGANVTAIGDRAFKGCTEASKITLKGNTLESIGPNKGSNNTKTLVKLKKKWKTCTAFKGVPRTCKILVPKPSGINFGPVENVRQLCGYAGFKGVVSW
ncbi:MAG: leucine-rich repeat protein [Coriobacteriales bacterium]